MVLLLHVQIVKTEIKSLLVKVVNKVVKRNQGLLLLFSVNAIGLSAEIIFEKIFNYSFILKSFLQGARAEV